MDIILPHHLWSREQEIQIHRFQGGSANICGLENKRSRSTSEMTVAAVVVSGTKDPDPLGFWWFVGTPPYQPQSRERKILIHDWEALLHSFPNCYGLGNDRSRSRVAPVDYLDFLSALVVGTVLQNRSDSISDTENIAPFQWKWCCYYKDNVLIMTYSKMWHLGSTAYLTEQDYRQQPNCDTGQLVTRISKSVV